MNEIVLFKYLRNELSEDESLKVEAWYNSSDENKKILEQLYYTQFIDNCIKTMETVSIEDNWNKFKNKIENNSNKENTNSFKPNFWKKALTNAAFLTGVVFVIGISVLFFNNTTTYIVATTVGQRSQFLLPDGSKVWLNSSTELAYKTSLWTFTRKVELVGEAYFEVAPKKLSSFVVDSKGVETRVLGTKFNIRARASEDRVVTTLLQGKVQVDYPFFDEKFILSPNEVLEINVKNKQYELFNSLLAKNVLLWINGKLNFDQVKLIDITDCLEQHFDVDFTYVDESLKSERFTCNFSTDDDLNDILFALSLTKGFKYTYDNKNISLSSY